MTFSQSGTVVFAIAALLFAAAPHRAMAQTTDTACWVTASGTIQDGDSFDGEAKPRCVALPGLNATGEWEHFSVDGHYLHGTVATLRCRRDGGNLPGNPEVNANLVDITGPGQFDGLPVQFRVHVEDRGEGQDKRLDFESVRVLDVLGNSIYFVGGTLESGNVQFHPVHECK